MAESSISSAGDSTGFVYSHRQMIKHLTEYIIREGQPFSLGQRWTFVNLFKTLNPCYKEITTRDVFNEAKEEFVNLGKEIMMTFASLSKKIVLACDAWHNAYEMPFLRVTAQWIDGDWSMQRRTIDFVPFYLVKISEPIIETMRFWDISDKVFAFTSDDVIDDAESLEDLKIATRPILDGKLFHARCVCRVLNSCVQVAMESVKELVTRIWRAILTVRTSIKIFREKYGYEPTPILIFNERNWDSVRDNLRRFIPYRDALNELMRTNWSYFELDEFSEQEWEIVSVFCRILDVFYEAVLEISSTYKPSSCMVILHLVNIAKLFSEYKENVIFNEKFSVMKETFLKHFDKIPELYCVAAVMDPRIKLSGCECLMESFYQCSDNTKVNLEEEKRETSNLLCEIYNLYSSQCSNGQSSSSEPSASCGFAWSVINQKKQKTDDSAHTELTFYLQTPFDSLHGNEEFDVLAWWKKHETIYPVLSNMARDLLMVPVSTLAPDVAFTLNEEKKILEERAFEYGENVLKLYTCLKDWFRAEKRTQDDRQLFFRYDDVLGEPEVLSEPEDEESNSHSEDEELGMESEEDQEPSLKKLKEG